MKPEEDEDKLKLTESQTTMLVSALKRLVAAGTIGAEWVTKAEKGTLTISELTWLNTIVLARK